MKKRFIAIALLLAVAMTAGCGSEKTNDTAEKKIAVTSPSVSDVLEKKTGESASGDKESSEASKASGDVTGSGDMGDTSGATASGNPLSADGTGMKMSGSLSNIEGVDIDLSSLSSTVVYAQVYNMMFYSEDFVGKTIRMNGIYSEYYDETTNKHYSACIIMDATACCSQGIEFELSDDYVYPDAYPIDGDYCTVEGVFDLYEEDGYTYCTLRNARLIEDNDKTL